jgi:hypothetical protein
VPLLIPTGKPADSISKAVKLENNWQEKTLEVLEKDKWGEPTFDSHLLRRCHELRKIQLKNFSIEDLRLMIGQAVGLPFLIPVALERLNENILAEGDLYPGDLLKSITDVNEAFWGNNLKLHAEIKRLISKNRPLIAAENIKLKDFWS